MENKSYDKIIRYVGISLTGFSLVFAGMRIFDSPKPSVHRDDANQDGIEDIVILDSREVTDFVLIGKGNGNYEKTKIRFQDGIPFFFNENGFYDPWGSYFDLRDPSKFDLSKSVLRK